jgi:hypothetical protein
MKKLIVPFLLAAVVGVAAFFYGKYSGAMLVRDGLVANYPTIKNLANRSFLEVDTSFALEVTADDLPKLFAMSQASKTVNPLVNVSVHAKYGTDLNSHFFKMNQNGNEVEAMLPAVWVLEYSIKNASTTIASSKNEELQQALNDDLNVLLPLRLEKFKNFKIAAKNKISEALMFYLIPYQFDLKIYFENQQFKLPEVVGLNKDVKEYIEEQVGKK